MNNKEIIENVSEQVAKDWDIKEHVWKKGNLWWQKAIEKALVLKDEELKEFIKILKHDLCLTPDMGICRKENGCLICERIMELAEEKLK